MDDDVVITVWLLPTYTLQYPDGSQAHCIEQEGFPLTISAGASLAAQVLHNPDTWEVAELLQSHLEEAMEVVHLAASADHPERWVAQDQLGDALWTLEVQPGESLDQSLPGRVLPFVAPSEQGAVVFQLARAAEPAADG